MNISLRHYHPIATALTAQDLIREAVQREEYAWYAIEPLPIPPPEKMPEAPRDFQAGLYNLVRSILP